MTRNRIAVGAATAALALTILGGVAHADDLAGNGCSVPCQVQINGPSGPTGPTGPTGPSGPSGEVMPNSEVAPTQNNVTTESNGGVAVLPAVQVNGAAPAVAAATAAPASGKALPVTGGDVVGLTVIGLAALGGGTLLVRRSRKHTA